jgi:tetratricopeptide (TPR) repeat protein
MSAVPPVENKPPPRVFISYSHDSAEHCDRVLALATRLRADGLDAQLDQFETSPPQGWPLWCARQILDSNYVLIVCTAAYRDRFLGLEDFGKGRGVKWEAKVIHNILYYEEVNSGFIPVIFDRPDAEHIPETVKEASWYLVPQNGTDSSGYIQLRQRLAGDKVLSPLPIPQPSEAYRQRDGASVPTEEVWESSGRIEEKLDNLRRQQKRQHRTVMASLAVLALLMIAGIIWFKSSTEKIVTDPEILRVKLEEKIKESFEKKHRELVARKATPAEVDQLYRLQEGALKQVSESVRFIQSTTKDAQATIAKKAVQIVQEDGVDRALKYLDQTISDEAQGHKQRARELAEASLLKAELQLNKLDYDGAQSAIKQAINFGYEWWAPHNRLGLLFYRRAQWKAAEAELGEAQRFVDSEKNTATILNNLAQLLQTTNRLGEAEPLMRRALAIDEKSYGPEHPNVARDLNNLAVLLKDTNRLAEAEPLMQRALAIDEKSYGPEHPEVATNLNNLALLLQATNRLSEAEPLMRRALAIDEKSYGPEHPDVARDLNNLATLLKDTNRLAEAEPLMQRALAIDEKSYGPEHPEVAKDLNNLALLLKDTNRMAEAEPLMQRALAISEKSYGPDHPLVAKDLNNLAVLLKETNRMAEAEPLMRRALRIDEKSYGPDHPDVARDLHNLAQLLQYTNRMAEAEPLMQRVVEIWKKSLGKDHPSVAAAINNLAVLLKETNRMAEAEPLMQQALAIDEKSYGPDHPNVARDLNNLALLLKDTNRMAEAEPLMRQAVLSFMKFKRSTGHLHPNLKTILGNYRGILEAMSVGKEEIAHRIAEVGKEAGLDEESYSAVLAELSK